MKKTTTLKVSKDTHKLLLKAKRHLKSAFKDFTLDVNVDNDFVVKLGAEEILNHKQKDLGAVDKWKSKK